MSEEKKKRSVEEINNEYKGLCLKAGDLNYRISALSKDIEAINRTLGNLVFEAKAAQDAEKAAAALPKPEPTPLSEQ